MFTYITIEPRAIPDGAFVDEVQRQLEGRVAHAAPRMLELLVEMHRAVASGNHAEYGTSGDWFSETSKLLDRLREGVIE